MSYLNLQHQTYVSNFKYQRYISNLKLQISNSKHMYQSLKVHVYIDNHYTLVRISRQFSSVKNAFSSKYSVISWLSVRICHLAAKSDVCSHPIKWKKQPQVNCLMTNTALMPLHRYEFVWIYTAFFGGVKNSRPP